MTILFDFRPFSGSHFSVDELVFSGSLWSASVGCVVFSGHKASGNGALSGPALVLCSLLPAYVHTGWGHSSTAGPALVINKMNGDSEAIFKSVLVCACVKQTNFGNERSFYLVMFLKRLCPLPLYPQCNARQKNHFHSSLRSHEHLRNRNKVHSSLKVSLYYLHYYIAPGRWGWLFCQLCCICMPHSSASSFPFKSSAGARTRVELWCSPWKYLSRGIMVSSSCPSLYWLSDGIIYFLNLICVTFFWLRSFWELHGKHSALLHLKQNVIKSK